MEKTIKIPDIITFTVVVKNDTVGIKNDTVGFKITFLNPEFTKWIFVNPYTSNDIRIISPKWHFGTMTTLVLVIQELLTYHVNKPHEHAERITSAIKSAAEAFRKNKKKTKNKTTEEYWEIRVPEFSIPEFSKITFQHEHIPGCSITFQHEHTPCGRPFTWNQITTGLDDFGLKVGDPIRDNTDDRVGCVIAYDDLKDVLHVANGAVIHAFDEFRKRWRKQYIPLTVEMRKIEKKVYVDKSSIVD